MTVRPHFSARQGADIGALKAAFADGDMTADLSERTYTTAWDDDRAGDSREMPSYVRSVTVRKPGEKPVTQHYRDGVPVGRKVLD